MLKALADPVRLSMLRLLARKGLGRAGPVDIGKAGLCASDVESEVGLSPAVVSHHLGIFEASRSH